MSTISALDPERGNASVSVVVTEAAGIGATVAGAGVIAAPSASEDENNNVDAPNSNATTAEDDGGNNEEEKGISLQELVYGASSYHAVLKPVSITMILAALSVIYINTEETKAAGEQALTSTYQVFTISDEQSAATSLGLGLINSLIIVCAIGFMTFIIVLLYKYRCMKILIGYMVLASTMLLGFLGGQMFLVAIEKYRLEIDWISFFVTMYNFAIVGVLAVFYQKGIPTYINQAYLVATSVIVAWQLSYFNAWMAWTLLIMLALYDLFAVLTPCGPLKALVKLMSKDDAPSMPGLLYEAQLPEHAKRPGAGKRNSSNGNSDEGQNEQGSTQQNIENANEENDGNIEGTWKSNGTRDDGNINDTWKSNGTRDNSLTETNDQNAFEERPTPAEASSSSSKHNNKSSRRRKNDESGAAANSESYNNARSENGNTASPPLQEAASPTANLPLAIAKVYKLPLVSATSTVTTVSSLDASSSRAYLEQEFTATELQTDVHVRLPRNGGRIETTYNKKGDPRYVVYNKDGEVKRTLIVNAEGKVMEITIISSSDDAHPDDNTIKLGLGDFIFYSVLVSKAAENGFASFVSCFLSTLAGLGGTLVLLAVYHHALPALPISIFLAVIMFVLTIYCMEPWIQEMWKAGPLYV